MKYAANNSYVMKMAHRSNPRQLVLRRDTATGLTLVGWESDLPVGRFEHLSLICERPDNSLPEHDSVEYDVYQSALQQARTANRCMLEEQAQQHRANGWYLVPYDLAEERQRMQADSMGNYAAAAMQLHYRLTKNQRQAWVIVRCDTVVHVRPRYPHKDMDTLTYQVWYHRQQQQLTEMGGTLLEGQLQVFESGLWFFVSSEVIS